LQAGILDRPLGVVPNLPSNATSESCQALVQNLIDLLVGVPEGAKDIGVSCGRLSPCRAFRRSYAASAEILNMLVRMPRPTAAAECFETATMPDRRSTPMHSPQTQDAPRARRDAELRLYGLNAVRAVFARRPQAIRKLYLAEARIPQLQPMLKWCVAHRVGYRVVDDADLQKLAASAHHEGVVADVLREEPAALSPWLRELPPGPCCALWLDGVGNPHNLGAILRSAAHFGVSAVLLPKHSALALSGAAARVAEGGAEAVPFVRLGREDNAMAQLRGAGFKLAATVVRGGTDLFMAALPPRLVYVMGAEGEGMNADLVEACDLRVSIPGSGAVESLNVASATAVLLAQYASKRA
jgi:RNA methyltransferase, TrmH family